MTGKTKIENTVGYWLKNKLLPIFHVLEETCLSLLQTLEEMY